MNKPQSASQAADQVSTAAERVSESADQAVKSTRRVANDTLDQVESAVDAARGSVQPVISKLATQAEVLARRGLDAVCDSASQVRERANGLSDITVRYVRDEPVKAVLIAAATGAALVAIVNLFSSRRDR
jgi:ElaB/YqjD/DUF883 family membrane-anchored ribosome-binding protein